MGAPKMIKAQRAWGIFDGVIPVEAGIQKNIRFAGLRLSPE
jgi:hypothetical protein